MTHEAAYSPLSTAAVFAALIGLATLGAFLVPGGAVAGVIGLILGISALRSVTKYHLSGRRLAVIGIMISLVIPVAATCWHVARFEGESTSDYVRVDYNSALRAQPGGRQPSLVTLVGHRICLKGYAVYERPKEDLQQFALTPDGDDRTNDQARIILVNLEETWDWQYEAIAVSGTLTAIPMDSENADGPRYQLIHASVRPARTQFQLSTRAPGRGC